MWLRFLALCPIHLSNEVASHLNICKGLILDHRHRQTDRSQARLLPLVVHAATPTPLPCPPKPDIVDLSPMSRLGTCGFFRILVYLFFTFLSMCRIDVRSQVPSEASDTPPKTRPRIRRRHQQHDVDMEPDPWTLRHDPPPAVCHLGGVPLYNRTIYDQNYFERRTHGQCASPHGTRREFRFTPARQVSLTLIRPYLCVYLSRGALGLDWQ